MSVSVAILTTLGCLQSLANLLYKFLHIEYYPYDPHDPLTNLFPTNQSLKFPLIEKLEGRHTNTGVIVVIIRKLNQR